MLAKVLRRLLRLDGDRHARRARSWARMARADDAIAAAKPVNDRVRAIIEDAKRADRVIR